MTEHRIYVELDAILDTRLATISKLSPDLATKMLNNEEYYKRITDEFWLLDKDISKEDYIEAYRTRDIDTLMSSRPTGLLVSIMNLVKGLEKRKMVGDPDISALGIDINIYPYKPTDEEMSVITDSLSKYWGIDTPIECVDIPYSKLSTEHISNSKWSILYMYGFFEWEESYLPTLKQKPKPIPTVSLIVPDLVRSMKLLAELEKDKPVMDAPITHREVAAIYFSEMIGITHLDISSWSIIRV